MTKTLVYLQGFSSFSGNSFSLLNRCPVVQSNRVYLFHPNPIHHPSIAELISDVKEYMPLDPSWNGWELISNEYDNSNGLCIDDVVSLVLGRLGPVVCVEKIKSRDFYRLRDRIGSKVVVLRETIEDLNSLYARITLARDKHRLGDPQLPRKRVAAILLVRKLVNGNYWAGNDKGYLWGKDLAKGRGVDEKYKDIIHEVAEDMVRHEILVYKISKSKRKYAVNPDRKPEVYAIHERMEFYNQILLALLNKDTNLVSVRELDIHV